MRLLPQESIPIIFRYSWQSYRMGVLSLMPRTRLNLAEMLALVNIGQELPIDNNAVNDETIVWSLELYSENHESFFR